MIISGDREVSYPDIHARIARAATGFRTLGLQGGTPVAMMLRNDFAFFEVAGAAAALGSPWCRSTGISRPRRSATS